MSDKTRQCSDLSPEIKINDCITWMPDAGVEITCESSREGERLPAWSVHGYFSVMQPEETHTANDIKTTNQS